MKVHLLKTIQPFYNDLNAGTKTFELRYNNREFKVGDLLLLNLYEDESFVPYEYVAKEITYVLADYVGVQTGYCIMGLRTPTMVSLSDEIKLYETELTAKGVDFSPKYRTE